jgi:hypothetical protein
LTYKVTRFSQTSTEKSIISYSIELQILFNLRVSNDFQEAEFFYKFKLPQREQNSSALCWTRKLIPVFTRPNHLPVNFSAKSSPQTTVLFLKDLFSHFSIIKCNLSSGLLFSGHSVGKIYTFFSFCLILRMTKIWKILRYFLTYLSDFWSWLHSCHCNIKVGLLNTRIPPNDGIMLSILRCDSRVDIWSVLDFLRSLNVDSISRFHLTVGCKRTTLKWRE